MFCDLDDAGTRRAARRLFWLMLEMRYWHLLEVHLMWVLSFNEYGLKAPASWDGGTHTPRQIVARRRLACDLQSLAQALRVKGVDLPVLANGNTLALLPRPIADIHQTIDRIDERCISLCDTVEALMPHIDKDLLSRIEALSGYRSIA